MNSWFVRRFFFSFWCKFLSWKLFLRALGEQLVLLSQSLPQKPINIELHQNIRVMEYKPGKKLCESYDEQDNNLDVRTRFKKFLALDKKFEV